MDQSTGAFRKSSGGSRPKKDATITTQNPVDCDIRFPSLFSVKFDREMGRSIFVFWVAGGFKTLALILS